MAIDPVVTVSLIIPTYNREELLIQTVRDALAQTYTPLEIIVVDQSARHETETEKFLRSVSSRILYLRESVPSLSRARNIGGRRATGPLLIFVDDDVSLPPDFVAQHVSGYRSGAVAAQGRIVESAKLNHKPAWLDFKNRSTGGNNYPFAGVTNVLTGCNMSVLKRVFEDLNGFDERFTKLALNEDTDFGYRLYRAGHKIVYLPEAWLKHHRSRVGGVDTGIEEKELSFSYYYCESLFAAKHFNPWICLYFRWCLMLRGVKAVRKLVRAAEQEARHQLASGAS